MLQRAPCEMQPRDATAAAADHYWPEIDGLRAVAILLVVAFHAGVPQLGGGFVGVDVFFVLSGYLITGLLAREIERTGGIDLVDFYARRARRLLPALAVVLVATLAAGAVLLMPIGEQQGLGKSAIAASAFLANIFFWRTQSSYFAGPSEEIPLLHLWTLSVEEQFYIVWPLVMIAIAVAMRRKPGMILRAIVSVLLVASLLSLAASWWLTTSRPTLAFYTMPFRAWEFGIGALLALVPLAAARESRAYAWGAALIPVGLAAIVTAAFAFSSTTAFPGVAAALPVLGTAAAVAGVRVASGSMPSRMLAAAPMVKIGKLSYSWYLWHWPLLAIGRASALGENSPIRDGLLVLLALGLSAATFRWIEEPVRRRRPWPFASRWSSVIAGLGLMAGSAWFAGLLWWRADYRAANDASLRPAIAAIEEKASIPLECTHFRVPFTGLAPAANCVSGAARPAPLVLLWGDSHAHHLIPAFTAWAEKARARILPRTMGACRPSVSALPADLPGGLHAIGRSCADFNTEVEGSIRGLAAEGLAAVVLSARWSLDSPLSGAPARWEADLRQRISTVRAAGVPVLLIGDGPGFTSAVPMCVARRGADACAKSRADVDKENAEASAVLRRIAASISGVILLDMRSALCTNAACPVVRDGVVLYSDQSHISVAASRRLAPVLGTVLAPLLAASRSAK